MNLHLLLIVPVLPEKPSAGANLYSSLAEWYWVVRAGEVRDWGLQGRVAGGDFYKYRILIILGLLKYI